jgi:hypothetical protein
MRWQVSALVVAALVMTSCGLPKQAPTSGAETSQRPASGTPATATATAAPEVSPTASPAPAGTLASCVGPPPASASSAGPIIAVETDSDPQEVELVDVDGDVLNQTPVVSVTTDGFSAVGQGPDGVYLYDVDTGELALLGLTGPLQELAQFTPMNNPDGVSLAVSPSGQCWILSDTSWASDGSATSELHVGVDGQPPVLLTTLTRGTGPGGGFGGGYQVLRWDQSGVLLGTDPTSVGGAGPFLGESYSLATVVRLAPVSGAVSPSLCPNGQFGDVAADGTMACLTGQGSDARIVVTRTDGSTTTIDTGMEDAGQIGFVGGSSLLTYCTSAGWNGDAWTTNLLVVQLGAQTPSPKTLSSGDGAGQNESSYPWYKLVNGTSIVELGVESGAWSLAMISLSTGQTTTVAPAGIVLGVL